MAALYILRSHATNRYYVGATDDPAIRLLQHNQLLPNPSRWTKGRGPWELAYLCFFKTKGDAVRAERFVKRMKSRHFLEKLISGHYDLPTIISNRTGEHSLVP